MTKKHHEEEVRSQVQTEANEIIFTVDNGAREVLRFSADGDIYVQGRLAGTDQDVVEGIREFLKQTGVIEKTVTVAPTPTETSEEDPNEDQESK